MEPLILRNIIVFYLTMWLITVRFSLLIYLVTFNILINVGSHIGLEIIAFNKILHFILIVVVYNGNIISLFYYSNAETFRDIEFFLIK